MRIQKPSRSGVLLAAVVVLSMAPAPAAAANPIDEFVGEAGESDDCLGPLQLLCGFRDGGFDRLRDSLGAFTDDRTASDLSSEIQTTFNTHAGAYQAYANNRTSPDSDSSDVVNITVVADDSTSTVYLTTDVQNSAYHNTSIDSSTDRTVDETCVLEGNAARNAPDELETFHDRFAEPDQNVTEHYMSEMATRYSGKVDCTFLEVSN